jgi:hypothetical protein
MLAWLRRVHSVIVNHDTSSDLTIPFGYLLVQDVQNADHVQLGGQDHGWDCRVDPSRDGEHEEHEEGED